MSDMVERVARAVYELMPYDGIGSAGGKPVWVEGGNSLKQDEARGYASAAIKAMRAPTDHMRLTLPPRFGLMTYRDVGDIWRSMIDAALDDNP